VRKSASDKDAGEDNDGDKKDTGKGDDCKEKAKRPKRSQVDCLLEKAQKLRSQILTTQSQAAQLVAASTADSQAWRENAAGDQRAWAHVFARRHQRREEKLHVGRLVCPLGGILGLCSRRPGVASRECEPAPHASHVQGPWLALIETH
jgi:hypothetical protein